MAPTLECDGREDVRTADTEQEFTATAWGSRHDRTRDSRQHTSCPRAIVQIVRLHSSATTRGTKTGELLVDPAHQFFGISPNSRKIIIEVYNMRYNSGTGALGILRVDLRVDGLCVCLWNKTN